jgi:hypothetical protein
MLRNRRDQKPNVSGSQVSGFLRLGFQQLRHLGCAGSGRRKRSLSFQHFKPHTDMTDYRKNAEKCRELAKLTARSEHWPAFLEMAETW